MAHRYFTFDRSRRSVRADRPVIFSQAAVGASKLLVLWTAETLAAARHL